MIICSKNDIDGSSSGKLWKGIYVKVWPFVFYVHPVDGFHSFTNLRFTLPSILCHSTWNVIDTKFTFWSSATLTVISSFRPLVVSLPSSSRQFTRILLFPFFRINGNVWNATTFSRVCAVSIVAVCVLGSPAVVWEIALSWLKRVWLALLVPSLLFWEAVFVSLFFPLVVKDLFRLNLRVVILVAKELKGALSKWSSRGWEYPCNHRFCTVCY